jgi:prophage regulatory protein
MRTQPGGDNPVAGAVRPAAGFMRLWDVLALLRLSKSTWYAGIQSGRYPKPAKLGQRISVWRADEIYDLLKNPR